TDSGWANAVLTVVLCPSPEDVKLAIGPAENSDVSLVLRFVAVAVTTWPEGMELTLALKVAKPLLSVVTTVGTRQVWPWRCGPLPGPGLAKNSMRKSVLAAPVSTP